MKDEHLPRMLIVDDEEGMRSTLRRIMRSKGFQVEVASSGEEAILLAQQFQPELLLLDIRMPGINGIETFRRLKTICPEAFAIFMTAYAASHLSQEALHEGAVEVFPKPLDIDRLCQRIESTLNLRSVLIVDDDPGFRDSLQRALTMNGFLVVTASDLDGALEQFRRRPQCVVLLDMRLNDTSGLCVLEQIRKLNQNAHTVLMTGFHELEGEMKMAQQAGACCTFLKPFEVDSLVAAINSRC